MSRTTRKIPTDGNYREVRKGKNDSAVWDRAYGIYRTPRHGGMSMSARVCGFWGDEYPPSGSAGRKATKRAVKRRERRNAMREHVASF